MPTYAKHHAYITKKSSKLSKFVPTIVTFVVSWQN
jgi:hypothetical protein